MNIISVKSNFKSNKLDVTWTGTFTSSLMATRWPVANRTAVRGQPGWVCRVFCSFSNYSNNQDMISEGYGAVTVACTMKKRRKRITTMKSVSTRKS